jgi:general secretion pathway protein B
MSFILDALRKSDADRQRAATPGLADVRYAGRRSRRNIWLPILVAVLAANVVFMGVQWFSRSSDHPVAEVAAPGPTPSRPPPALPAAASDQAPAANIRPLARETEFGEPQLEPPVEGEFAAPPVVTQEGAAPAASPPVPAAALAAPPAAPATGATATPDKTPRIRASEDLPTVEEVIGSGAVKIPMLNLDLHVYSEQAANRFVIINAHKYKEGSQLTEGPTVESITKDGVILSSQGRRFTLSRR